MRELTRLYHETKEDFEKRIKNFTDAGYTLQTKTENHAWLQLPIPSGTKKPQIALQNMTITNPLDQTQQAVLNIWYIGSDIVIGGVGWYEYYAYEKLPKKLLGEKEEKPQ